MNEREAKSTHFRCKAARDDVCDSTGVSRIQSYTVGMKSIDNQKAMTSGRSDHAATRAGRIGVRRYTSAAEADRHDLEFWMQMPDAERILLVWRLSQELWRLRGDLPDEP